MKKSVKIEMLNALPDDMLAVTFLHGSKPSKPYFIWHAKVVEHVYNWVQCGKLPLSAVVGKPEEDKRPKCPGCGTPADPSMWVNPSCPNCEHSNAILEGVCRDCKKPFPELAGWVEYRCRGCGARFNVKG